MPREKIAIIPAYKPESIMIELLRKMKEKGYKNIVVNDGSGEEFADLFCQAAEYAVVLVHPVNRGKGSAIKTGLTYILQHFSTDYVVVTLDADGQHTVFDAERVCRVAQEYPEVLVLGSRKMRNNVPLRSKVGNAITRFVYRISTKLKIYDTQSGLRAFSGRLLPIFLNIPGERYEYEMNVLLTCPRNHIFIREIEVETIYINNNATSHFNIIRDSYSIYKEILKFSASSFVSFIVDYSLYSLLLLLTIGMKDIISLVVSNIGARIVSASLNYILNRKLVFQSKNCVFKSVLQYFTLTVAILVGNTLMLKFLVETLGFNRYLAKLCTEILFFVFSWFIQRWFIFRRDDQSKENTHIRR